MAGIGTVLVANRGEIAVRIIRTLHEMGLRAVAVHSEADREAPHVLAADETFLLGPAPVSESYLSQERILEAARVTGADAIHPGYGFLSENEAFAGACKKAGIVFIGPPPEAIAAMGNKAAAKRLMLAAKVPCVPGFEGEDQSDETLIREAVKIGFPLMVKAAAGGGGRGMRFVQSKKQLPAAIELARSEAESAFGSGELILEKAITNARHVEVQVFADTFGNIIHLGERDCSVQRRHQKVIEEAPSPAVDEALRARMGKAAVDAAAAVGYVGAGTVEFLLGPDDEFYFLEMNTRLQVEHPVTELVTGFDLVRMQVEVAAGQPLAVSQDKVRLAGHAIEVRLYAEDTAEDFMPSTGAIELWRPPGDPLRTDAGIVSGAEVTPHYDPMLAKVISRGASREEARRVLVRGLSDTLLFGPATNRDFLIAVLDDETFTSGAATTDFLERAISEGKFAKAPLQSRQVAAAAVLRHEARLEKHMKQAVFCEKGLANWSNTGVLNSRTVLAFGDARFQVSITVSQDAYRVLVDGEPVDAVLLRRDSHFAEFMLDGEHHRYGYLAADDKTWLAGRDVSWSFHEIAAGQANTAEEGQSNVIAGLHGRVVEIAVKAGDLVQPGDVVCTLEAMKMMHQLKSPVSGTVKQVHANVDEQVPVGMLLVEIEEDS